MPPSKNALQHAPSAYLRSAMYQPVQWREWNETSFEAALAEDKPILLDIGAVWCHWCHVMDRESYENEATASIINEQFIPIKVDRDERPDIDTRYQAAVSAISGQGGWPLTAFLTPDGRPFFGGTYFPPDDRHGRPGLPRVLLTMAEAFQKRRDEVDESAGEVMLTIEQNESFSGGSGTAGPELVGKLVEAALQQFDSRNGGFGSQPKFPHCAALDLLIDAASRISVDSRTEVVASAKHAATVTLEKMARGGIYDQLAGGFHRYSVDERWIVPHFEKMAYDNSELLKNYVHGYQTFVEPEFARVAREIVGWMDVCLSDREHGGFYSSQDADVSPEDNGDYFTWTRDEAAAVLTPEELAIAGAYFEIDEIGNMHHNPARNVLHVNATIDRVARSAKVTTDQARVLIASAREKLLAAREQRPTPYIDKTLYTGWNAMCISAYLEAARILDMEDARSFALRSLDRALAQAWDSRLGVAHVIAYGEADVAAVQDEDRSAAPIPGTLDDYVLLAHASLDAFEMTGDLRYFTAAEAITNSALKRFYDRADGGFFDTDVTLDKSLRIGALATHRKPIQDSPTPAGNPVIASLLFRLEGLNGREDYLTLGQETLETFAGVIEHFGLYAASYGIALQRMLQRPIQICIIGDDADAHRLETVALARFAIHKSVIRLRRDQLSRLPPELALTLPHLTELAEPGSLAIVCSGSRCEPPVRNVEALLEILNRSV